MDQELPKIQLKIERRSSHPWIFQKMVEKPSPKPPGGTVVDIVERDGKWVARGIYNGHSRIALRVLTTDPEEQIDGNFFRKKIGEAVRFRREVLRLDEVSDAYRLIHSEGDGLSGLIVDRFGDIIVLEFFSSGMYRFRSLLLEIFKEHFPNAQFYWFAEEHIQKQESFDCYPPALPAPTVITENGVKFNVAPGSKHKTGFFVDQRENRNYLSTLTKGQRVLDLCCNSGGFAVYAKSKGEAADVTAVDLDEGALAMAEKNANLNRAKIRFVQSDIFNWLRVAYENKEKFDVVILDPAKQTRSREEVLTALKRYTDMNRLAMHVIKPGGILLTCSCTGLVSEADFIESVRRASWQAARTAQIFKISGAGPDHPIYAHASEGRYLKAVWARIF